MDTRQRMSATSRPTSFLTFGRRFLNDFKVGSTKPASTLEKHLQRSCLRASKHSSPR